MGAEVGVTEGGKLGESDDCNDGGKVEGRRVDKRVGRWVGVVIGSNVGGNVGRHDGGNAGGSEGGSVCTAVGARLMGHVGGIVGRIDRGDEGPIVGAIEGRIVVAKAGCKVRSVDGGGVGFGAMLPPLFCTKRAQKDPSSSAVAISAA